MDHFRGLEAYYEIPAGAQTAETGRWVPGPGAALLTALEQDFPTLPLIAEDLGYITPAVTALKNQFNLPGMYVLQFAFYDTPTGWATLSVPYQSVIYTGTHDNNTTRGWYKEAVRGQEMESCLIRYLGPISEQNIVAKLIELAYAANSNTVIIPAQDLLDLDETYRMNTPGTVSGNWQFRLAKGQLSGELQQRLARLTARYDRGAWL